MEEYTKGVVEEYIAYQRRVLKTLLDRGVYTPEGIEDHIRMPRNFWRKRWVPTKQWKCSIV